MTINLLSTQHSMHHAQVEWNILSGIISQFAYFESNKKDLVGNIFVGRLDQLNNELTHTQAYLMEFNDDYRHLFNQLLSKLPADDSLEKNLN